LIGKVLSWVIIILIVVWIISDPAKAGTQVHGWIQDIVDFFTHLASG